MTNWWQAPVTTLKGIGPKRAEAFGRLEIFTLGDLLNFYPRSDSYLDYSRLSKIRDLEVDGSKQVFLGEVVRSVDRYSGGGKRYGILTVRDETAFAEIYLFGGQRYLMRKFKTGSKLLITGRVKPGRTAKMVSEPLLQVCDKDALEHTLGIMPVYPLTESLTQNNVRDAVRTVLEKAESDVVPETVPEALRKRYGLLGRMEAVRKIHFPRTWAELKSARKRLIYEELFLLQCGLLLNKEHNYDGRPGVKHGPDGRLVAALRKALPFSLTDSQEKAWKDISADMQDAKSMNRLLQGDVGSGKTVLAALALAKTVENGFQGCMMAPTEILARQHHETLSQWFEGTDARVALLTSNTKPAERRDILEDLALGRIGMLVGTHALLQEDVRFASLALVITDEQHRFGVNQRAVLTEKSELAPDVLVMTATPIPRTLALTVYGDVDVSSMKGKPPGRKEIDTLCYLGDMRPKIYEGMVRQIRAGRQVYVVCASIEESEGMEGVRSVNEVYNEMKETWLRDIPCALLHGKMKPAEKEAVMEDFASGKLKALVTTTVIEVGVNVPNATLMIVENADRFGLAQLHQLRGRVGRGDAQSYCVLLTDNQSPDNLARLNVLHSSNDGFVLSERDLELRGAGQLFGLRQHGLPDLRIADILRDTDVLLQCRKDAQEVMGKPALRQEVLEAAANQFDGRFAGIFNS